MEDKIRSLVQYVGYPFIVNFDKLYDHYLEGRSISLTVERVIGLLTPPYQPVLPNLSFNETLHLKSYSSIDSFMYLSKDAQPHLRSLFIGEESIQLTNQLLEYLCSAEKVEEMVLAEERHTLTSLPFHHLPNLRYLFICQDQHVQITDDDFKFMPNLEFIELSSNNTITNEGLKHCPKLKCVILHSNEHVTDELGKYKILVSKNQPIDVIPEDRMETYYRNFQLSV